MREMPEGYSISLADAEDIPAVIAVDKAASSLFADTGLIAPHALNDHVPTGILDVAQANENLLVLRNRHGWVVGFALVSTRGNGLYLDQISVHPDHGQQGLGRALVLRVLSEAETRRLPHVSLSTFRDLPWNGPFYASMGFKEIARAKYEPYMQEIESAQEPHMDISARCFMRRKVRRGLLRFGRKNEDVS